MKKLATLLLLISSLFISCEEEVDLFTEHGETPVVFAILQPHDSIQYFRINPTFIGEGDARSLAGDPSVTSYAEGEIEVKVINLDLPTREYPLKDTLGIKLDSDGIFHPDNRLYYFKTEVDQNHRSFYGISNNCKQRFITG